jgi:hypothetical protein
MLLDKAYEERQFGRFDAGTQTMQEAEQSLEQAWKLDPSDHRAANFMLAVKYNNWSDDENDGMELWFGRAMDANPDNYDACQRKLNYLNSRGEPERMLEFGRWCLGTQNWRANIPFILARAHELVASGAKDRKDYYAQPRVWEDMRGVFEGCVLNFPEAALQRSQYAKIAAQCSRWDVAHQQFQILGEKAVAEVFGGKATLDYYKRKAARLAGSMPGEPDAGK